MGIWHGKGGLTTQQNDHNVREHVWETAQSMSISNKLGAGPEQWNLLIDCSVTGINHLVSIRLLWTQFMEVDTNLNGQKQKEALDEFSKVGLRQKKQTIDETPTNRGNSSMLVCILSP